MQSFAGTKKPNDGPERSRVERFESKASTVEYEPAYVYPYASSEMQVFFRDVELMIIRSMCVPLMVVVVVIVVGGRLGERVKPFIS